jgi:hypothetical protein
MKNTHRILGVKKKFLLPKMDVLDEIVSLVSFASTIFPKERHGGT